MVVNAVGEARRYRTNVLPIVGCISLLAGEKSRHKWQNS